MVLIFSAPSGAGKSTLVNHLLDRRDDLEFSISATTRAPRGQEQDGREYYFLSPEEFERRIAAGDFLEYENVYAGTWYGTLRSEIDRIEQAGHHAVFDVDVQGGARLKQIFGDKARAIFIAPPGIDELRRRLIGRATDSAEKIEERLAKAEQELAFAPRFDRVIVNDDLAKAKAEVEQEVNAFLH